MAELYDPIDEVARALRETADERDALLAIVGDLAASDPTVQTGDTVLRASPDGVQVGGPRSVRRCVLCGRDIVPALWPHDPSCPWLRSHVIGGTQ